MRIYLIVFILFFVFTFSSFGQSIKERQIEIFASASIDGTKFKIKINTNKKRTKLIFKIRDSISTKMDEDKDYNKYSNYVQSLKSIDLKNDTIQKLLIIFDSIIEKYTFYSVDSIDLANSENKDYLNLTNEVFKTPTDSLDNKILNKNRYVFDGIHMTFTLMDGHSKRKVSARTPTLKSHRLLYELVTNSIRIYRDSKKNNFLNKSRLFGY